MPAGENNGRVLACSHEAVKICWQVSKSSLKVSMSWLGILHIHNIWNPVIRIAIYLVVRKCYLRGLLTEVTLNQESVLQWIHAVIYILKIYHLIWNRIGTIFDENKQKFLNPWLVCILKHRGVTRQLPGLTSLPLTVTAKKSTKITFSNDKIYFNFYHRVPNIINM